MSLSADIGQLLWFGFDGQAAPDELLAASAAGELGAVILFRRNLTFSAQSAAARSAAPDDPRPEVDIRALVALNRSLHQSAPENGPPLLIAVDQEGGRVQRVRAPAPSWPPMLQLTSESTDPDAASARCRRVGLAMGQELVAMGFDINFAPVLDVHTNPANPIIGNRAFGSQPEAAAAAALAYADGLAEAGILSCGKHFPGHGDTDTDSHLALPRLPHDLARLRAVELLPFRRAVAAELPMIMTAHVIFAALDPDVPATLSERVMTGLLRRQLGYRGVVVSDDLDMRAIAAHFGIGEAAVRAVRAGCDALLLCRNRAHQEQARTALLRAAEQDSDLRARVAESAERIRSLKRRHAARTDERIVDADAALALCAEHRAQTF